MLPEYHGPVRGIDVLSVGLFVAATVLSVYGLKHFAVVPAVAGVGVGVWFVMRQRVVADPLVETALFRGRFGRAVLVLVANTAVTGGVYLL